MRKRKIGIILDNPKRDQTGTLLLSYELANRGIDVHVIPSYSQYFEVPLLGLDAVVLTYARVTNLEQMQAYKDMGLQVFILDTEGGLISSFGPRTPENWAKFTKESTLSNYIDHYLFWGEALYGAFAKWSGLKPEQMHLSGCPRYDVTGPKWRALLPTTERKFVLLNSSFPSVNPKFTGSKEKELKTFEEAGLNREYSERLFSEIEKIFFHFSDVLCQLIESNPQMYFLMRPHPFENETFYIEKFSKYPNVKVECKGEIFDVLNNCYALVHVNCGSAIDARFMGKIPLQVEWINHDTVRTFVPLPSEVSVKTMSLEKLNSELRRIVSGNLEEGFSEEKFEEYVRPSFAFKDAENSARCAKIISENVERRVQKNKWTHYFRSCRLNPRPVHRLMAILYFFFGIGLFDSIRNKINKKRNSKFAPYTAMNETFEKIKAVDQSTASFHFGPNKRWGVFPLSSVRITKI